MTIIIIHKAGSLTDKSVAEMVARLESFGYKVATAEMKPTGSPERDIVIQILPEPAKKDPPARVPRKRK
jgi:hypothetical protein